MNISPARIAAYEILLRVERDGAYSSILLPEYEVSLPEKDKALCHQLVLGVLRRKLYLDAVIGQLSGKRKLDIEIETTIRLGLFQLLFLQRIPDHSAVNESVNLAIHARKRSAKGFVNALLRRVSREEIKLDFTDDLDRISIETSHPRWLLERWISQFGQDDAVKIADANNEIPRPSFRITPKGRTAGFEIAGDIERSDHIEDTFLTRNSDAEFRNQAERGEIYFQDEGSQLVGSMVTIPENGSFLDVCAAPGSKTAQIADRHLGGDCVVIAGDLHLKRVELLKRNCINQGIKSVSFVQYNAERDLPFAHGSFDTILVDAPCSGTGTIRNNPEIRYSLQPDDIRSLQIKQLAILSNASKLLRGGGNIVYSTCSLEFDENEGVIEQFMASTPGLEIVEPGVSEAFVTGSGFARTFPHRDAMDGFFIAKLARR